MELFIGLIVGIVIGIVIGLLMDNALIIKIGK